VHLMVRYAEGGDLGADLRGRVLRARGGPARPAAEVRAELEALAGEVAAARGG